MTTLKSGVTGGLPPKPVLAKDKLPNLKLITDQPAQSQERVVEEDVEQRDIIRLNKRLSMLRKELNAQGLSSLDTVGASESIDVESENNLNDEVAYSVEESTTSDSLDLKAKRLIQKSECTLSSLDRVVSSSCSSTFSYSSTSSNKIKPDEYEDNIEEKTHKPEFLKFIENKDKPGNSRLTGEPLKPEDDILYQWRLRRKLENEIMPSKISIKVKENEKPQREQAILVQPNVISSQTQTVNMTDSEVQTYIEDLNQTIVIEDTNNIPSISLSKTSPAHRKVKKEPKINSRVQIKLPSPKNMSTVIIDTSQKPQTASQRPKTDGNFVAKPTKSSPQRYRLSRSNESNFAPTASTVTASISTVVDTASSISSTMTNITAKTITPAASHEFIGDSNQARPNTDLNQTVSLRDSISNSANTINLVGYETYLNDEEERNLIDSDEILQMLFNKTRYYQMKIKEIDELLQIN